MTYYRKASYERRCRYICSVANMVIGSEVIGEHGWQAISVIVWLIVIAKRWRALPITRRRVASRQRSATSITDEYIVWLSLVNAMLHRHVICRAGYHAGATNTPHGVIIELPFTGARALVEEPQDTRHYVALAGDTLHLRASYAMPGRHGDEDRILRWLVVTFDRSAYARTPLMPLRVTR